MMNLVSNIAFRRVALKGIAKFRQTRRNISSLGLAKDRRNELLQPLRNSRLPTYLGGLLFATCIGQYFYGKEQNFYDYRFIVDADPDDLADFYGSENFMDIYCVLPFMGTLMMRGGYFDEDGTVHTTGIPGEMLVSMVFSSSEEDELDENVDSPKGPPLASPTRNGPWFNKRERFKDVFFGYTMWDMVTNFGFETLSDGRLMVYHHGEYFKGNVPPLSLLVRLVFGIHARWVAWATDHHLNHYAFHNDTDFDEKMEHDSRVDMPLFLLRNYAWSDLAAALFGKKVDKPSFLIKKSAEAAATSEDGEVDVEEEEEPISEEVMAAREKVEEKAFSKDHELPFQDPAIMRRITMDINVDRRNSKITLGSTDVSEDEEEAIENLPRRHFTKPTIRRIPTSVALNRYHTTLKRSLSGNEHAQKNLKRHETLGREHLGGHAAWEAIRSTNNPEAYKAASIAARSKFTQRRVTLQRHDTTVQPPKYSSKHLEISQQKINVNNGSNINNKTTGGKDI